jgi:hypothetical protein
MSALPVVERILQQITTVITAAVDVPVYRSRDAALASTQLPAVVVTPLQDDPSESGGTVCWIDWTLTVAVDVVVGAGVDQAAHPLRAAAHAAIMADRELAPVPGVMDLKAGPTIYRMQNVGGEHAFLRSTFTVMYRTRHDDLTVAP